MALGFKAGLLFATIVGTLWSGALAQTTNNCMFTIVSLYPCLTYIQGGGSGAPSGACCSALTSVVDSRPECLCTLLGGGIPSLGITIDRTKALELPGACKVQTPPVSLCKAINGSPASAPSADSSVPADGRHT